MASIFTFLKRSKIKTCKGAGFKLRKLPVYMRTVYQNCQMKESLMNMKSL